MATKYNVYYATSASGPWTLANDTPLDHNNDGMEYTVSGLSVNTQYFVSVVGGEIVDGEFLPLISQAISRTTVGAGNIGAVKTTAIGAKTFSPHIDTQDGLSNTFSVTP